MGANALGEHRTRGLASSGHQQGAGERCSGVGAMTQAMKGVDISAGNPRG